MFRPSRLLAFWASFCHPLWRVYARLRRAEVDAGVVMNGRPLIRCARGGSLRIGEGVRINTSLNSNPVIGRRRTSLVVLAPEARLEIGEGVGLSGACICAANSVTIGRRSIIGADALISDTDFHTPLPEGGWTNDARGTSAPVRIGEDCFVGARAIILKGVTIGDGAVIAAGAVVVRAVPAGHLAAGNPAINRPLGQRWSRSLGDGVSGAANQSPAKG